MADRQNTVQTYTVVASPADDSETVVAIVGPIESLFAGQTFKIHGWVNITDDADTTAIVLTVRRTSLTGTAIGDPSSIVGGATTSFASATGDVYVADPQADVASQLYVLTVTCTDAGGASTVDNVYLDCRVD